MPFNGERNQEEKQEGGILQGEIIQEQNQEDWDIREGACGWLMYISSSRVAVSGTVVDGSKYVFAVAFVCEELIHVS